MNKTREAGQANKTVSKTGQVKEEGGGLPLSEHARSIQPRPRSVFAMGIVLVVLLASLLTLYFKTVYPIREKSHTVEIDKPERLGAAR